VLLSGCTKHYTISVSVVGEANGTVVTVDSVAQTRKSLLGDNDVEGGTMFEYSAVPNDSHYQVEYIKVDGTEVYNVAWGDSNKYKPFEEDGKTGIIRPMIDNVSANHTVEVAFGVKSYTLSFYYNDSEDETPHYVLLTVVQDGQSATPYTITQKYNTVWTLEGFDAMEFRGIYVNDDYTFVTGAIADENPITGSYAFVANRALITNKSKDELLTFLGISTASVDAEA
jgi:hypothetical protein